MVLLQKAKIIETSKRKVFFKLFKFFCIRIKLNPKIELNEKKSIKIEIENYQIENENIQNLRIQNDFLYMYNQMMSFKQNIFELQTQFYLNFMSRPNWNSYKPN